MGQELLKHFSTELRANLRITDICFRYDLNKIIALLPNTNLEQAKMTCDKLSKVIDKDQIRGILSETSMDCSINVGFAEARKDLQFEHLLKEAETRIEDACFLSRTEE